MEVSVEETKHFVGVAGCSAVAAVSAGRGGDVSGCGHRADLGIHQGADSEFDYRKHGQFDFTAPAILFACLVFTLTAPLYIWKVLGL